MTKRRQIVDIGRDRNQQVRIEFPTANGTISAIYTVSVFHSHAGLVILGEKIQELLSNCKLSNTNTCEGRVKAQIMIDGLDDYKANERGELTEHLSHDSQNHKLVVIAPHGGDIEEYTDKQAEYVGKKFSSDRVSLWICKGFSNKGGSDAFERWHITSTEISEKSFPKLNTIFGPKFEYSIAFHGWGKDIICVGGSENQTPHDLKQRIKDAIQDALLAKGSKIEVKDSECPEGFNSNDPKNIVNRLGANGIQIEQCKKAREDYHDVIAQAVVDAIRPLINV
jgi:phage replication-related protein YjqB (UPF0714/DUF867 family)